MPNHIMNRLRLEGDQSRIDELLKCVKGEDSILDFNKIIPMPESLNIEAGIRTEKGLKAYKDFVYVYTFAGTEEKDLLNIPKEKEEIFLRARQDIRHDEWELGKAAFHSSLLISERIWRNNSSFSFGTFSKSFFSVPSIVYTVIKSLYAFNPFSVRLPASIFNESGIGRILLKSKKVSSPFMLSKSSFIFFCSPEK